ncbi:TonB-dependent receptor domain-containing protein [Arcicella lustrica]|uniref:TonB-dependent receptor n=1 Tax=Arcicella lustrica TaxID=2984196 RepID=A0ABU5SD69_9BACT|nr:TonB-dependent receptor [Arcicella sp. DC25W]MEA5425236.1 TonB-dependent receptor [Arcicella sp. DC25W]
MKFIITILLTIIIFAQVQAQSKISGKVLDEKQKPAEFATAALLNAKDSSMVKADITNLEGLYTFEAINSGKYLIATSMVGYKRTFSKPFEVISESIQIPDIQLNVASTALNEVTVTAQKPFLEQRADKLVVNVASSPTAAGATALEVLRKVPGLIIAQDRITIVGKASVMIMIDGKPSQYTDMNEVLKDLPSTNIDKIEVIKNPSARYDAAGGAIINIVMKRNANLGTNGSIGLNLRGSVINNTDVGRSSNDMFNGISPTFSINHRKGKVNVFGSYSYANRNLFELTRIGRIIGTQNFDNTQFSPLTVQVHNTRAGMDFYADKKNTFGFLITGFARDGGNLSDANTKVTDVESGEVINSFRTMNSQPTTRTNIGYNINWKHSFDTTGKDLNVDIDYVTYRLKNQNIITIIDRNQQRNQSQSVDNPVVFTTFKLDYTHPFSSKTKLEVGGKSSFATIDNDLNFYRETILDTKRSNVFNYKENINALYGTFNTSFGNNWELQTGLRAEQTVAEGFSKIENKNVLDRNYWQLFPSVFLTRKIGKNLGITTSFTRRIDRPSYQQQNPFEFQLDSLTFTRGNPLLKPQLTNELKFQVTFDGQPFFAFGYNKTNDVIIENAPQQDNVTKRTFTTAENLATYKNYFVELNFPINIGKRISGYGGNQLIYNVYDANYLGGNFNQGRVNWLAYINVNAKITKTLSAEVNGFYMTKSQQEFLVLNPLGSLSVGLQQKVLNGKGRISLSVNDILYTEKNTATIKYQDIDLRYFHRESSRNVRLGFTYSFGNDVLKASRNRKTGSETEANRVKTN